MSQVIGTIKDMSKIPHTGLGFVPTMGAIHEGHLSLMRKAVAVSQKTVVSIFVNPLQFGADEDFNKYPQKLSEDIKKIENEGIDYIFTPTEAELYPGSFMSKVDVIGLTDQMCGQFRPGHFSGVATVMVKLLNIVRARYLFLGQKDFQQTVIIKKLIQDLNFYTKVIVCPTIREDSGLAMSSRNNYLSADELNVARSLYAALKSGEKLILQGERRKDEIVNTVSRALEPFTSTDYVCLSDPETLEQPSLLKQNVTYLILAAVRLNQTRLIDNILIKTN